MNVLWFFYCVDQQRSVSRARGSTDAKKEKPPGYCWSSKTRLAYVVCVLPLNRPGCTLRKTMLFRLARERLASFFWQKVQDTHKDLWGGCLCLVSDADETPGIILQRAKRSGGDCGWSLREQKTIWKDFQHCCKRFLIENKLGLKFWKAVLGSCV